MEIMPWIFAQLSPETWKSLLVGLVGFTGAVLGATLGSFSKSYFGDLGKNLATKRDFEELQTRLAENTKLTKTIESSISTVDSLRKAELAYREKQLSDLYGPIYSYLKSQLRITEIWLEKKMIDKNHEVKLMFTEQNKIMRELFFKNAHLIEGPNMPEFFVQFFTNTTIFDLYASPTLDGEVPEHLDRDPRVEYSHEFDKHIIETTESIKKRIDDLHRAYTFGPTPIDANSTPIASGVTSGEKTTPPPTIPQRQT